MTLNTIRNFFFGKPLDPLDNKVRQHIALATFLAWVGLGADGISSACYGPEETFLALGSHSALAIILAVATGVTVFLIALSYNQIIEKFPSGGGGYKVASTLISPKAGLVAGGALVIDYVLTIAISIAAGVDALYSLVPDEYQMNKVMLICILVVALTYTNLRGMKESVKILMPIFLGFIITHIFLILYGIFGHAYGLEKIIPEAVKETKITANELGWVGGALILFKAFSLGGGTYTGLEAVSNSITSLAEPRVKTAKATMLALATSLAFMAMGTILIYLLWNVEKVEGQTLNATAFLNITEEWKIGGYYISEPFVFVVLLFEALLLFVAANTGFISGPNVLAAMASDRWLPMQFSSLSSRLVTRNGVIIMGVSAIICTILTKGVVHTLVILYSINVFITFCLSLTGITLYNLKNRKLVANGYKKILLPLCALIVCSTILTMTIYEKFFEGGWLTLGITGALVAFCIFIRKYYKTTDKKIKEYENEIEQSFNQSINCMEICPDLDEDKQTAVILLNDKSASGLYSLKWINDAFPNQFSNFVFVSVGEIDHDDFIHEEDLKKLKAETRANLKKYIDVTRKLGLPAEYEIRYSTDVIGSLTDIAEDVAKRYKHSIFFTNKLINDKDNPILQFLYNQIAYILQRRLHNRGMDMIVIPLRLH